MPKPANRPVIAVDVDDVLAAEMETVRHFINKKFNANLTREDYLADGEYWGFWERVWGVGPTEGTKRYQAYLDSFAELEHKTVDQAIDAINKLKQSYNLVIITSRHDSLIDITHTWLDRHFPKTFHEVAFVKVWNGDQKASKATIAKELKASYLIDDNADHCNLTQEIGIQSLLFGEYGWNRNVKLAEGIIRVKNWQEVLEYFDAKG